ncbi:hypothetical protein XACM_1395 [Xanthomonas euvesicatoria pv. citrumelo F1]|nr:hypothetical protein XACM_1395 [Xanthomonas euvesicatoria pv. citrumelo F1]
MPGPGSSSLAGPQVPPPAVKPCSPPPPPVP